MRRTLATSAAALMLAAPAVADDWSVLVIGSDGDAVAVSNGLAGAGVRDVRHLLDGGPRDIVDAVQGIAGADRVLVYFNGPLAQRAGQPAIGDDPRLTVAALADSLFAGGARQAALLVENCGPGGSGAPIAPPVGSLRGDFLLAASAGPGAACAGPVLTQALLGAGTDTPLETVAQAGWVGVRPAASFSIAPAPGSEAATVAFLEPRIEGQSVGAVPTTLFIAPPAAQIAAIPVPAGFPQPSIIVGIIQVEPEQETLTTVGAVTDTVPESPSLEITYDNLETRTALRESDPEAFAALVAGGAFDPPSADLARAIQSELARMDCYTSSIDGLFGRGSQAAVARYYDERGVAAPASLDASAELFRDIILNEDVECPPVVVAQPQRTAPSSSGSSAQAAAPRPTQPRPAPAPQPQPQTSTPRITGGGIGVFR